MYNQCQVHCYPGTADEVLEHTKHDVNKVRAVRKDPWKDYLMIVEYPDIIKSPVPMAIHATNVNDASSQLYTYLRVCNNQNNCNVDKMTMR